MEAVTVAVQAIVGAATVAVRAATVAVRVTGVPVGVTVAGGAVLMGSVRLHRSGEQGGTP